MLWLATVLAAPGPVPEACLPCDKQVREWKELAAELRHDASNEYGRQSSCLTWDSCRAECLAKNPAACDLGQALQLEGRANAKQIELDKCIGGRPSECTNGMRPPHAGRVERAQSEQQGMSVHQRRAMLPNIDVPPDSEQSNPGEKAVLIGIADYEHLPDVPYADFDVSAVAAYLKLYRGLKEENVHVLQGEFATAEAIREHTKQAAKDATFVWFYFAGNGATDLDRVPVILGQAAPADAIDLEQDAVRLDEIDELVRSGGGSSVLILDASFGGKTRSGRDLIMGARFAAPNFDVGTSPRWFAAAPDRVAAGLREVEHGAFTYMLLGALRGWGDKNGDGRITAKEAHFSIDRMLRAIQANPQAPMWSGTTGFDRVLSVGTEKAPF